ncbi:MAG: acyl--CoA ligase [Marinibacterium sp.]|nr:acyl--CoA ligase [Marinibacterium sp.]
MTSLFDQGPPAPCPRPFNMAAHVLGRAAARADHVALIEMGAAGDHLLRYGALEQAVRGTGTGLLRAGLRAGDIVILRLGNTRDFPIAYLGAIAAGIVPVPTSTQLTEPEVARIYADLAPAAVLSAPGVATPDHPRIIDLETLRGFQDLPACPYDMGDPDRQAYIVYTSGTSGQPRAVSHAHRAIWARQMMIRNWYDLRPDDRLLHAGAFNWTFTLGTGLMDPWSVGATALIAEPGTAPDALPDLLARHHATLFAAAPGVFRKMLGAGPLPDLPHLRHGLAAGEKLPPTTAQSWANATGTPIYEAYGMSECSTFISGSPASPVAPDALGRPQPGRRVAIVDDAGHPVELNQPGIIAIHRSDPGLMLGYVNAESDSAARFRGNWFLTGDLGEMTPDHQIRYLGRNDDMMNAGGYRVSPIEVEAALAPFPGLSGIGVTDVEIKPDVRVIAGFYTADQPIDTDALGAFAARHLARYKQPRLYQRLTDLPTSANGKLLRAALRPLYRPEPE